MDARDGATAKDNNMSHNPFEPHPVTPEDDGLDDLKKPELVAEAEKAGLSTSGTKTDLIGRLREHRST